MLIQNTHAHLRVGIIVDPLRGEVEDFELVGRVRICPVENDTPGRPFVLDAAAAKELAAELNRIVDEAQGRYWINHTSTSGASRTDTERSS